MSFKTFLRPSGLILTVILIHGCNTAVPQEVFPVRTGAEVLIEHHLEELEGQRVGLVMNPTARIGQTHMLDTLLARGVDVAALFAPEHGFRGEAGAGEVIENGVDQATGLPVFSLYGETRKPTGTMLEEVDLLIFDMQDVGARFYTYNSTLGLLLEAAAEYEKPVWLLDRPNPAGGDYVSGWMMDEKHQSFVGMYPIPIAHGMTLGELGKMMIGEKWIDFESSPPFRVIPMKGWQRSMKWPETGLGWTPPSPNLPTFEHAFVYLGTCLVEGTTLSEGRGTKDPFLTLGSPSTNFDDFDLKQLQSKIQGAQLVKTEFVPVSIPGKAVNPKHEGIQSSGLKITVTDYDLYEPVESGLRILTFLMNHTKEAEVRPFIYRLAGTDEIRNLRDWEDDDSRWDFNVETFRKQRAPYLIYESAPE
ncbi:MAG: DUF1343 domain-containing protein [Balneolaceae bacterium]